MAMSNPAEAVVLTSFNDPQKLADYGYNGQVVNENRPPTAAVTFDAFDSRIFPADSEERVWAETVADRIDARSQQIHAAGLKAFYFTDIITLPRKLVSLYADEILDASGHIDLHRAKTQEIHRVLLDEVFERFPGLDGLVIRTGRPTWPMSRITRATTPSPRDRPAIVCCWTSCGRRSV